MMTVVVTPVRAGWGRDRLAGRTRGGSRFFDRRWLWPFSLLLDQGLQVGLQSWTIFGGRLQEQVDQLTFPGAKVPADPSPCQSVEQRDRLLHQQLFEFVGGHASLVKPEA